MARRIRTVKPEWLEDERLNECSDAARVLSIGLLLMADDSGRGRLGKTAARDVFQGDTQKFEGALGELRGWYARRYEVRGQHYYAVVNWHRHQYISKPSSPRTPEPQEGRWLDPETTEPLEPEKPKNTSNTEDSGKSPEGSGTVPVVVHVGSGSGSGRDGERKGWEGNAGEPAPTTPAPGGDQEEPRLTICPLDLLEKAEKVGIIKDFVERYRVDAEQIRDGIREFTAHWTIGGGAGRKEANWPRKLRTDLKFKCETPGKLKSLIDIQRAQPPEPSTGVRRREPEPAEDFLAEQKRQHRKQAAATATPEELAAGERTAEAVTNLTRGLLR